MIHSKFFHKLSCIRFFHRTKRIFSEKTALDLKKQAEIAFKKNDFDFAILIGNEALQEAESIKLKTNLIQFIANCFIKSNRFDDAKLYFEKSKNLFENAGDLVNVEILKATLFVKMGKIEETFKNVENVIQSSQSPYYKYRENLNEFILALIQFEKYDLVEKLHDQLKTSEIVERDIAYQKGMILYTKKEFLQCIEALKKGASMTLSLEGEDHFYAQICIKIAECYKHLEQFEEYHKYLKKAKEIYLKLLPNNPHLVDDLLSLYRDEVSYCVHHCEFDVTLKLNEDALKIAKDYNLIGEQVERLLSLALTYKRYGNLKKALSMISRVHLLLPNLETPKRLEMKCYSNWLKAHCLRELRRYEDAISCAKEALSIYHHSRLSNPEIEKLMRSLEREIQNWE